MTTSVADLGALFGATDETGGAVRASFNIAPTASVAIVRLRAGEDTRVLSAARWGFTPTWAVGRPESKRMINARAETVASSRMFSSAFETRRCVVPSDGWYEWTHAESRSKRPYFMTRRDGDLLGFAGLWTSFRAAPEGEQVMTCCVITTEAVGSLVSIHDRMPLTLPREHWGLWLGDTPFPACGPGEVSALLRPPSAEMVSAIECRPVGRAVGNVRNDGPDLVCPMPSLF